LFHPRVLHSFPTRRSSDLAYPQVVWLPAPTVPGCRGEAVATDALWSSNLNLRGAHMRQFVALVAVAIAVGLPSVTLYAQDTKYRSEEHTSELQSRFDLVCR